MKRLLVAVFTASICLLGSGLYVCSAPTQGNSFHVGDATNNDDIEIYSGVLRPCTNGGVDLGGSSNQFGALYISGTATIGTLTNTTAGITTATIGTGSVTTLNVSGVQTNTGIRIQTPQVKALINAVTESITPTSSFVMFNATGTVTLNATSDIFISTIGAVRGQYLVLTTTGTGSVIFPTGTSHYIIGASSPTEIGQNDTLSLMFNGTYWVCVSSSVQ
jgi:hypothetical protein